MSDNQQPTASLAPSQLPPFGSRLEFVAAIMAENAEVRAEEELPEGFVVSDASRCTSIWELAGTENLPRRGLEHGKSVIANNAFGEHFTWDAGFARKALPRPGHTIREDLVIGYGAWSNLIELARRNTPATGTKDFAQIIVDEAHRIDSTAWARSKAASRTTVEAAINTIGADHCSLALARALDGCEHFGAIGAIPDRGIRRTEEQK